MNNEAKEMTEAAWYAEAGQRWSESRIFEIEGIRNRIRKGVRMAGRGADFLDDVKAAAAIVGSVEQLVTLKAEKAADAEAYKGHLLQIAEAHYEGTL
ncbi:MAG TPA: hypothetical protein VFJ19_17080 [Nocardioidaceae bacterium]|nr:hypothetical protein [Nocardioidaceae bacterium]